MKARLFVLHTYGDVEPEVIAGPLPSRAHCLAAAVKHLGTEDADPEGGYFILRSSRGGLKLGAEAFTGAELDDARQAQGGGV